MRAFESLQRPLKVAWISDFPVEWLPDPPDLVRALPRRHPATWQISLLSEFAKDPSLQVHVIVLRHRIARSFEFEHSGGVFHVCKARPWMRLGSLFWLDTLLLRRVCRRLKPDLVHAWGMEKGAGLIAQRLGYPYVLTVQGLYAWYKEQVPLSPYDRFVARLEARSLPRAPVVTTESTFAVQYLKNRYPSLRVQQAEHAPNRAFLGVQRRPDTNPPHFISVGTINYRKGTDLLFQALDELASKISFKFTLVSSSEPNYLRDLKSKASATLLQRTAFKHFILPHQVAAELQTPTLLLLPTRADTSPNAVKEAVVASVPVVASEVGGIPDYVFPGKNGILFPAGDLPKFVEAIQSACSHPLFSQGQVEPETLSRARNYLSPELMAENFLRAYKMAMADEQGKRRSHVGT